MARTIQNASRKKSKTSAPSARGAKKNYEGRERSSQKPVRPHKVARKHPVSPSQGEVIQLEATPRWSVSAHLWLRLVREEDVLSSQLLWNLEAVIDEHTSQAEWRKAWSTILKVRRGEAQFQGSDPRWFSTALKSRLLRSFESGVSYGELAMDCNFDLLLFLLWASDQSRDPLWPAEGWLYFANLLDTFAYNPRDFRTWLEAGQESLKDGKLPWKLRGDPITTRRMIVTLNGFRANLKSRKLVLRKKVLPDEIDRKLVFARAAGYWYRTAEMLKKADPKSFAGYKERLQAREKDMSSAPFQENQT